MATTQVTSNVIKDGAITSAKLDTNIDISGVATASTFEPDGDTAAGDNAAIGYTAAEGLILTGQGSSHDVVIKNDADALVLSVATGTTTLLFYNIFEPGKQILIFVLFFKSELRTYA